jgi:hypothetical protein
VGVPIKGKLDRSVSGKVLDILRVRAASEQDREAATPILRPVDPSLTLTQTQ